MGLDEILEGTGLDWAACSGGWDHDGKYPNAQTEAVDARKKKNRKIYKVQYFPQQISISLGNN